MLERPSADHQRRRLVSTKTGEVVIGIGRVTTAVAALIAKDAAVKDDEVKITKGAHGNSLRLLVDPEGRHTAGLVESDLNRLELGGADADHTVADKLNPVGFVVVRTARLADLDQHTSGLLGAIAGICGDDVRRGLASSR